MVDGGDEPAIAPSDMARLRDLVARKAFAAMSAHAPALEQCAEGTAALAACARLLHALFGAADGAAGSTGGGDSDGGAGGGLALLKCKHHRSPVFHHGIQASMHMSSTAMCHTSCSSIVQLIPTILEEVRLLHLD